MKRTFWFLIAVVSVVWAGCGSDDSSSNGGTPPTPVPVNGYVVIPSSWAGTWEITLTFRDCSSNAILSQEVVTSQVCPQDTLVNPFSHVFEACSGERVGNHLEVSCQKQSTDGACQVTTSVDFTIDVSGNQLSGGGTFQTTATPECTSAYVVSGCRKLNISGTRLSSSTAGCDSLKSVYRGFLK